MLVPFPPNLRPGGQLRQDQKKARVPRLRARDPIGCALACEADDAHGEHGDDGWLHGCRRNAPRSEHLAGDSDSVGRGFHSQAEPRVGNVGGAWLELQPSMGDSAYAPEGLWEFWPDQPQPAFQGWNGQYRLERRAFKHGRDSPALCQHMPAKD